MSSRRSLETEEEALQHKIQRKVYKANTGALETEEEALQRKIEDKVCKVKTEDEA